MTKSAELIEVSVKRIATHQTDGHFLLVLRFLNKIIGLEMTFSLIWNADAVARLEPTVLTLITIA